MAFKKAFVFDTNFIKQNMVLNDVVDNLSENYTVYVTQISIEERIGQRCREDRQSFDELQNKKSYFERFAKIVIQKDIDEHCKHRRIGMQNNYSKIFNNNIIPIPYHLDLINVVLQRACDKKPPFSSDQNASDKGFKDFLLWLSVVDYFKNNGEDDIVLLTDDNGFLKNKKFLTEEFKEKTGKNIEIFPNAYYKELVSDNNYDDFISKASEVHEIANIEELRNEIEEVFYSICQTETTSDYGFPIIEDTYKSHVIFLLEDTEDILNRLPLVISKHIFEKKISVYEVFDIKPGDMIGFYYIEICKLEKAMLLYKKIKENYPQYLEQFFEAVTKIFNGYYEPYVEDTDELPF